MDCTYSQDHKGIPGSLVCLPGSGRPRSQDTPSGSSVSVFYVTLLSVCICKTTETNIRDVNMAQRKVFHYFAFGSNMLRERILINNPTAKLISSGKLQNYNLCYETPVTKGNGFWFGATANIRKTSTKSYVIGLVWELSIDDLPNLDRQEENYEALEVPILMPDGSTLSCRTYQLNEEVTGACLPDPYYKKVVVGGAKQNNLPEDYIAFLESFEDTKDTTVPPGYYKVLEVMKKLHGKEEFLV